MGALEDVRAFIALVRGHEGDVSTSDEGCPPELVDEAERVLGLRFPPSYRAFLTELNDCDIEGREFAGVWRRRDDPALFGGAVGMTLTERAAGLPWDRLVLRHDGIGGAYLLDTSVVDAHGEAPVIVTAPCVGRPERVAGSFGTFALTDARQAVAPHRLRSSDRLPRRRHR